MVAQTTADGLSCFILGRWDQSTQPQYSSDSGGTWAFSYANGDTDCGNPSRTWAPTFVSVTETVLPARARLIPAVTVLLEAGYLDAGHATL